MHDAKLVHEELCSIARTRLALHAREARLLVLAEDLAIWRDFGCASFLDYLDRFCDLSPRTGREYVRVARALSELPNLREALDARRINYSTARELTRVATPENECTWLREAEGLTAREIEEAVAGRARGDGPNDPRDVNRLVKLTLDLREATFAAFMEVRSQLRDEHGERLTDDEVVMTMCAAVRACDEADDHVDKDDAADDAADDGAVDDGHGDHHDETGDAMRSVRCDEPAGVTHDDTRNNTDDNQRNTGSRDDHGDTDCRRDSGRHDTPGVRRGTGAARPPYQLSLTTCRSCAKTLLLAAGRQVEVPSSMRAAAHCDAVHIGDLESDAPQRAVSSVTPRIRRQVLARDGHRCTVPGCRSKRFLQLHHIVPQAAGGPHKPSNITTICFAHHQNGLHDGKLLVTGCAPHTLTWTRLR